MKVLPPQDREEMVFRIIKRLLAKKGIIRYEIINAQEEASRYLPGGIYPESGNVVTEDGHIYSFWLDWDDKNNDYNLGEHHGSWREQTSAEYFDDPLYIWAKKKLGIT